MNSIASYIDHTLLKPETSAEEIHTLCNEAIKYQFKAVCIPPHFLPLANELLQGTEVLLATVVGFPLGYVSTSTKCAEVEHALSQGAREIDMVLNICALKSKDYHFIETEFKEITSITKENPLKVIIETALLNEEEKKTACRLCLNGNISYVKTSTGFSHHGATIEDIQLIKSEIGDQAKIKASGGIKDLKTAHAMIAAGAHRLGTSSGVKIANEESREAQ